MPNSRDSIACAISRDSSRSSLAKPSRATSASPYRRPSKCFATKPDARLAMLTYLPIRSLLTRATKSSGLNSTSSMRALSLARDVVAQPLGIHPELEIAQRRQAGAAALRHLLAARQRDEAVHVDRVGRLATREAQHRRPEQRVEVDDVLADEVHLLDAFVGDELVEALRVAVGGGLAGVEVALQRREVADRRVEPHVEVLARRVRDRDAEVRLVARDVPVGEAAVRRQLPVGVGLAEQPFGRLVADLGLQTRHAAGRRRCRRSMPSGTPRSAGPTA